MYEKLNFFNKVVVRVTWFFLIVGSLDHWGPEFFGLPAFIPFPWAGRNIMLIFFLVAVLIIGEIVAVIMKRRLPKEDSAAS